MAENTILAENYSPTATFPATENGIKRRSVSIFSRRGTGTPPPVMQALAMSTLRLAPVPEAGPAPAPAPKHKRWRMGTVTEEKPKGTILRAVPKTTPPVRTGVMSPLEKAMATSPNQEILDAISQQPTTSQSNSSSIHQSSFHVFSHVAEQAGKKAKRERKDSAKGAFIGVWKDGKTQWEQAVGLTVRTDLEKDPETANSASEAASIESDPRSKSPRPKIQISIPSTQRPKPQPFYSFPFLPPLLSQSQAKPAPTPKFQISPPSVTSDGKCATITISSPIPLVPHAPIPRRVKPPMSLTGTLQISGQYIQRPHGPQPSISSSSGTSFISEGDDVSQSNYSNRTSMTSVESHEHGQMNGPTKQLRHKRSASAGTAFSVGSPVNAGVFDDAPKVGTIAAQMKLDDNSTIDPNEDPLSQLQKSSAPASKVIASQAGSITRRWSRKRMSSRRGNKMLLELDQKALASFHSRARATPSPTFSEVERDLQEKLAKINSTRTSTTESDILAHYGQTPPLTPPPRSFRRSQFSKQPPFAPPNKPLPALPDTPESMSEEFAKAAAENAKEKESQQIEEVEQIEEGEEIDVAERDISAEAAERLILLIMENLESLDDLFSTALLNKGFYQVFKRHELHLMRRVLKNMSPAAWEYRETCHPVNETEEPDSAAPKPEYTPEEYLRHYTCDAYIIDALKSLIVERCQSLLRPVIAAALVSEDPAESARVDDAFWRIWTFCKVFGAGKGREEDIFAQMDWLRGGLLAHQETCTSTIASSDSFFLSNVLLSAAEHFGKGNMTTSKGLGAEELYDMMEIWNCLGVLVHGLRGRTEQAREYGVFDNTEVRGGDIDGEEVMLEEWLHFLLTLGLSPILDLATTSINPLASSTPGSAEPPNPAPFIIAREHGWTSWTPPLLEPTAAQGMGPSRSAFLKEAVSRVYEERIAFSFAPTRSNSAEMQEVRRARGETLAAEIKLRKRSAEYVAGQVQGLMDERPMSNWEDVLMRLEASPIDRPGQSPTRSEGLYSNHYQPQRGLQVDVRSPVSSESATRRPSDASTLHSFGPPLMTTGPKEQSVHPAFRTQVQSQQSPFQVQLPPPPSRPHPSTISRTSNQSTSTAATTHQEYYQPWPKSTEPQQQHSRSSSSSNSMNSPVTHHQHPLQAAMLTEAADPATNSAEKAIFRIVEMGFTADEARLALRTTDMGDGLRIDRAVELLLRQME